MVKPPEQLDLTGIMTSSCAPLTSTCNWTRCATEKELAAEHTRILSAKDPGAPHNITRYRLLHQ